MFSDRTAVDDIYVGGFPLPGAYEAARFEFAGDGRRLGEIELAAQCVKTYFFSG